MRPLPQKFYKRNTLEVAKDLLGSFLIFGKGKERKIGMICETEAYHGEDDLACHASRGKTKRTEVMYGPGGYWYVYLIYGMYYCLNIVTEKNGFPAAVLIRGVRPLERIEEICDGPGKLCRELGVSKDNNNTKAFGNSPILYISEGEKRNNIMETTRVGVNYAGHCKNYPWRFLLKEK